MVARRMTITTPIAAPTATPTGISEEGAGVSTVKVGVTVIEMIVGLGAGEEEGSGGTTPTPIVELGTTEAGDEGGACTGGELEGEGVGVREGDGLEALDSVSGELTVDEMATATLSLVETS